MTGINIDKEMMRKLSKMLLAVTVLLFTCCSDDTETKAETPVTPAGKTLVVYYS